VYVADKYGTNVELLPSEVKGNPLRLRAGLARTMTGQSPRHQTRRLICSLLESHRSALKWMLRFTRAMHLTMGDPDISDKKLAGVLEGRLIQLEHLWRRVHAPRMSDADAEELIAKHFPG